uniref:polymorphic toxin type 44 domain-containing protein n=1 Tax=Faucicola boevrei TaxID=346665 RepID=UPI000364C674
KPNPKQNEKGWLAVDTSEFLLFDKAKAKHAVKLLGTLNDRSGRAFISIHQQTNKGVITIAEHKSINWIYRHEAKVIRNYWEVTKGLNSTNPDNVKDQAISRKDCPHKIDGAIKVAEYIVDEIKRNVKSLVAQRIRYHNTGEIGAELQKEFDKSNERINKIKDPFEFGQPIRNPETQRNYVLAFKLWYDMVDTNKDWDHKPKLYNDDRFNRNSGITVHRRYDEKKQEGEVLKSHYHKYRDYDYFYDIWSNIHYGYVGLSVGFGEQVLLFGSTSQQVFNKATKGADTPDDVTAIKIGFQLYEKFGKFAEKLTYQDVLNILDKTAVVKMPNSKHIHWCYNTDNPDRIKK